MGTDDSAAEREPVAIRELATGDRPGLLSALRSDGTFRDDEVGVALELIDDALAKPNSDYWFRIATAGDGGAIAGYICFGPTPMTASTFDLYWIVTHADHRGKGVASTLIRAMEDVLVHRGGTGVRVETSQKESYGAARKLYDKLGYPITATFEDFYSEGDALIVYYKRLGQAG